MDDVAVLDRVVLAFESELPRFTTASFALVLDEVGVGNHFRADETPFDVAVDPARGLARRGAATNGPGPALVVAGGEERDQVEERVARPDEAVAGSSFEPLEKNSGPPHSSVST